MSSLDNLRYYELNSESESEAESNSEHELEQKHRGNETQSRKTLTLLDTTSAAKHDQSRSLAMARRSCAENVDPEEQEQLTLQDKLDRTQSELHMRKESTSSQRSLLQQSERSRSSRRLQDMRRDNQDLSIELESQRSARVRAESELHSLRQALAHEREENTYVLASYRGDVKLLEEKLHRARCAQQEAETRAEYADKECKHAKEDLEVLQEKYEHDTRKVITAQSEVRRLNKILEAAQDTIAAQSSEIREARGRANSAEEDASQLALSVADLENRNTELCEKISSMREETQAMSIQLHAQNVELCELKSAQEKDHSYTEELQSNVEMFKLKLTQEEKACRQLKEDLDEAQDKITRDLQVHLREKGEWEVQIQVLQSKLDKSLAEAHVEALQREHVFLEKESNAKSLMNDLRQKAEMSDRAQLELNKARAEVVKRGAIYAQSELESQSQIDLLRSELETCSKSKQELLQSLAEASAKEQNYKLGISKDLENTKILRDKIELYQSKLRRTQDLLWPLQYRSVMTEVLKSQDDIKSLCHSNMQTQTQSPRVCDQATSTVEVPGPVQAPCECSTLKLKLEESLRHITAQEKAQREMKKLTCQLETTIEHLRDKSESIQKELQRLEVEKTEVQSNLTQTKASLDLLQNDHQAMEVSFSNLQDDYDEVVKGRGQLADSLRTSKADFEILQAEKAQSEAELLHLEESHTLLKVQHTNLQDSVSVNQSKYDEAQSQLARLESILAGLEHKNKELQRSRTELHEELVENKNMCEHWRVQNHQLEIRVAALTKENEAQSSLIVSLQSRSSMLEEDMETKSRELEVATNKLRDIEETYCVLRRENVSLRGARKNLLECTTRMHIFNVEQEKLKENSLVAFTRRQGVLCAKTAAAKVSAKRKTCTLIRAIQFWMHERHLLCKQLDFYANIAKAGVLCYQGLRQTQDMLDRVCRVRNSYVSQLQHERIRSIFAIAAAASLNAQNGALRDELDEIEETRSFQSAEAPCESPCQECATTHAMLVNTLEAKNNAEAQCSELASKRGLLETKYKNLAKQHKELIKDLERTIISRDEFEKQLNRARDYQGKLEGEIQHKKDQITRLQATVVVNRKQFQKLEFEKTEQSKLIGTLQEEVQEHQSGLENTRGEVQAVIEMLQESRKQGKERLKTISEQELKIQELSEVITMQEGRIRDLEKRCETENVQHKTSLAEAMLREQSAMHDFDLLRQQLSKKTDDLHAIQLDLEKSKATCKRQEAKIVAHRAADSQLEEIRISERRLESELCRAQLRVGELEGNLERALRDAHRQNELAIARLERINELQQDLEASVQSQNQFESYLREAREELQTHIASEQQLEARLIHSQNVCKKFEDQVNSLQEQNGTLETDIGSLRAQNDQIRGCLREIRLEMQSLSRQNKELTQASRKLSTLTEENNDLQKRIEALQALSDQLSESKCHAETNSTQLREGNHLLSCKMLELRASYNALQHEHRTAQAMVSQLEELKPQFAHLRVASQTMTKSLVSIAVKYQTSEHERKQLEIACKVLLVQCLGLRVSRRRLLSLKVAHADLVQRAVYLEARSKELEAVQTAYAAVSEAFKAAECHTEQEKREHEAALLKSQGALQSAQARVKELESEREQWATALLEMEANADRLEAAWEKNHAQEVVLQEKSLQLEAARNELQERARGLQKGEAALRKRTAFVELQQTKLEDTRVSSGEIQVLSAQLRAQERANSTLLEELSKFRERETAAAASEDPPKSPKSVSRSNRVKQKTPSCATASTQTSQRRRDVATSPPSPPQSPTTGRRKADRQGGRATCAARAAQGTTPGRLCPKAGTCEHEHGVCLEELPEVQGGGGPPKRSGGGGSARANMGVHPQLQERGHTGPVGEVRHDGVCDDGERAESAERGRDGDGDDEEEQEASGGGKGSEERLRRQVVELQEMVEKLRGERAEHAKRSRELGRLEHDEDLKVEAEQVRLVEFKAGGYEEKFCREEDQREVEQLRKRIAESEEELDRLKGEHGKALAFSTELSEKLRVLETHKESLAMEHTMSNQASISVNKRDSDDEVIAKALELQIAEQSQEMESLKAARMVVETQQLRIVELERQLHESSTSLEYFHKGKQIPPQLEGVESGELALLRQTVEQIKDEKAAIVALLIRTQEEAQS